MRKKVKSAYNDPMSTFDYSDFWNEALRQIHEEFATAGKEQDFLLWFNIEYISSVQGIITLSVPSAFYRDRLQKLNYVNLIENKLYELLGSQIKTEFIVKPRTTEIKEPQNSNFQTEQNRQQTQSFPQSQPIQSQNSFVPNYLNSSNVMQQNQNVFTNQNFSNSQNQVNSSYKPHPHLNERYNFKTFVCGELNSFAYNACIAVSKNPGKLYNPLLIYGGVGLGKTHLMQAIGNEVYSTTGQKVVYVTAETFTNEFIQSLGQNVTKSFKDKYRTADVLLIDDIHFFKDKDRTQEELFHTFNALYDYNKQIIFTCDRPVSELKNLTDRLRTRFQRGLNIDLQPPDYETRCAILSKKVESQNNLIPREVIELIAKNVVTNVRDLEASLTKLIAYTEIIGKKVTVEIAQQQLRDIFGSPKQGNITVENIQKVVAESFGISFIDLKSKKRTKNIALPRHIAVYISKELTEYSTTELGIEFGGRDHTTIMNSISKVEELLISDPTLETRIQSLIRKIKEFSS